MEEKMNIFETVLWYVILLPLAKVIVFFKETWRDLKEDWEESHLMFILAIAMVVIFFLVFGHYWLIEMSKPLP